MKQKHSGQNFKKSFGPKTILFKVPLNIVFGTVLSYVARDLWETYKSKIIKNSCETVEEGINRGNKKNFHVPFVLKKVLLNKLFRRERPFKGLFILLLNEYIRFQTVLTMATYFQMPLMMLWISGTSTQGLDKSTDLHCSFTTNQHVFNQLP